MTVKLSFGLLLLFVLLSNWSCKDENIQLFVTNDSGLVAESSNDLYFDNLNDALLRVKQLKLKDPSSYIEINVAPGDYYLKSALVVSADMSGLGLVGAGSGE